MMQLIPLFFVGLFVSLVLTPMTIRLARTLGLVDDPRTHKHPAVIHRKPIPRAGGLPVFLSIAFCSLVFLPMDRIFASILIAGFFVVLIGLLDDKFDLSPYLRFFANIFFAGIVVFQGLTIPFITNPFGGILHFDKVAILPQILAVLWVVWIMNMLNWSKGVDGQMPGIAMISAIIIGIASLRFPVIEPVNVNTAKLAFLVAGSAGGFLVYNFYPAKIFPGYSGTILGFTIAILSVLSGVKLATAILVMGVPTIDGIVTVVRRIAQRKSPFRHDRGHLHHLLLKAGFGQRSIAIFYWVTSFLLGFIALNLSSRGKIFAIILVGVVVIGAILTLRFITKKEA